MAFQLSGFQRNAYQMLTSAATAVGKIKKRLRQNAKIKARADDLAEKYKRALEVADSALVMEAAVKQFSRETTFEDVYQLPKVEKIDFEAMTRDAKAKKEFLQAVKLLAEQEEEEMALMMLLGL